MTRRYDYEEVDSDGANKMMDYLRQTFASSDFKGKTLGEFKVAHADDFAYTDPIDGSVSTHQGLFIKFEDGSRIIFRLSGTGSSGATVRLYVEKYSKNESEYGEDAQVGLKPLIDVALQVSKLQEYTKRDKPTVITVSSRPLTRTLTASKHYFLLRDAPKYRCYACRSKSHPWRRHLSSECYEDTHARLSRHLLLARIHASYNLVVLVGSTKSAESRSHSLKRPCSSKSGTSCHNPIILAFANRRFHPSFGFPMYTAVELLWSYKIFCPYCM